MFVIINPSVIQNYCSLKAAGPRPCYWAAEAFARYRTKRAHPQGLIRNDFRSGYFFAVNILLLLHYYLFISGICSSSTSPMFFK